MTALVPEGYEGREQAFVKHTLLKSYLEKLLFIIGSSARGKRHIDIRYVDCFAGPWGSDDEDLGDTSIGISLRTLASCQQALARQGASVTMRALFIEKNRRAFTRLEKFIATKSPQNVAATALHGDFLSLRQRILDWCGSEPFVFFFIDPKGWKEICIAQLTPLLRRPRSEFLINFPYNNVNRTSSMAAWRPRMAELLGEALALEGLSPSSREERIVDAYREGIKSQVPSPSKPEYRARTAYVRILDPNKRRVKYHLVYVTSHPQGIIEFMDASVKVDRVQRRVRAEKKTDAREQLTGMGDLFADTLVQTQMATAVEQVPASEVDDYWLKYLARGPRTVGRAEFADILEETNWLPTELQDSLMRLVKTGRVVNLDADCSKRTKNPLKFDGRGETLALASGANRVV